MRPSTYKIPACSRPCPRTCGSSSSSAARTVEQTIHRSKAVGEPPFMLGISVFHAISDAISSLADYRRVPPLDAPATPEQILFAVDALSAAGTGGES